MSSYKKSLSERWESTYEINNYGTLFYSLVKILKPKIIVELGTKAGYSAYHMAKALKENGSGKIDCYDLWENYKFTSCNKSVATENLKEFKGLVSLNQRDIQGIEKNYDSIDMLHIDLGNDGNLLDEILLPWLKKVNQLIIIEGGSKERDKVEWMGKYRKRPIVSWLKKGSKRFNYVVIEPFPSITLIQPK